MDAKITLSFDKEIIGQAKEFAFQNNISLSRLTEFLYSRVISGHYQQLEDLPVSDWVHIVAEGKVEYQTKSRTRKSTKNEYYSSRK